MEGFSRTKCEIAGRIPQEEDINVILMKKTYISDGKQLIKVGIIQSFLIASAVCDRQYRMVTCNKNGFEWSFVRATVVIKG